MAGNAGGEIMDISDTPDVAVWAKGIRKGVNVPPDTVKEPSKIASLTLHVKGTESREVMIDPADKNEVAKARGRALTDESGYGKQE